MVLQDNALKLTHNQALTDRRTAKLREAGAFRRPLGGARKFRRGFRAQYGELETPTGMQGSTVINENGPIDIKLIQVAQKDSSKATPKFATGDERLERKRELLENIMTELRGYLEDVGGRATMSAAALHLKKVWGAEYRALLSAARVETLADGVRLFPQLFELSDEGLYVNAV